MYFWRIAHKMPSQFYFVVLYFGYINTFLWIHGIYLFIFFNVAAPIDPV